MTEVRQPKKCRDEGFKWGGEDVRMGGAPLFLEYRIQELHNSLGPINTFAKIYPHRAKNSYLLSIIYSYLLSTPGQCLTKLNVTTGDSRDSGGRARFMIWNPKDHLLPREMSPL